MSQCSVLVHMTGGTCLPLLNIFSRQETSVYSGCASEEDCTAGMFLIQLTHKIWLDAKAEGQARSSAYCNPSSTKIMGKWLFADGG